MLQVWPLRKLINLSFELQATLLGFTLYGLHFLRDGKLVTPTPWGRIWGDGTPAKSP